MNQLEPHAAQPATEIAAQTVTRMVMAIRRVMETGAGDWPAGLASHTGAERDGGFLVFEIWRSQADQERFMEDRLAPALQASGVEAPPSRAEWVGLQAHHEHPEEG